MKDDRVDLSIVWATATSDATLALIELEGIYQQLQAEAGTGN